MKKKSQLSEELKRHLEIVNYTDTLGNELNEALKVTFQEQEPTDPENDDVEISDTDEQPTPPTPPTPGATPPTPSGGPTPQPTPQPTPSGGPTPQPTPPTPGATPPTATPPPPPPPAEVEEDVEEVDVTDLVNNQSEVGDSVNKFASQLTDIESKFDELTDRLSKMDMIFQKIDSMEDEIQKLAPVSPLEKMELRSLDSFPYNQRLDSYFEDKKAEYKKLRGIDLEPQSPQEKEYTLTAGQADEWDDNEIGGSFNPSYSLNEEKVLVQSGIKNGNCFCVHLDTTTGDYSNQTLGGCDTSDCNGCCGGAGMIVAPGPSKGPGRPYSTKRTDMRGGNTNFTNNNTIQGSNLKGMARKGIRVNPKMMR